MIERRLNLEFKEKEVPLKIRYKFDDWSRPLSAVGRIGIETPYLAIYDSRKSAVIVDNGMPRWYIPLGVLFEMIYHGDFFIETIESITDGTIKIVHDEHRCVEVERFVLLVADESRTEYINARIELYEALLKSRYRPIPTEQMSEALEMLQGLATLENLW